MKERPILFSAAMVRAILEGRKMQTRRVVKHRGELVPEWATFGQEMSMLNVYQDWVPSRLFRWSEDQTEGQPLKSLRRWPGGGTDSDHTIDNYSIPCPYGAPGDRLWVKETSIITPKRWDDMRTFTCRDSDGDKRWVQYLATSPNTEAAKDYGLKITPSIFMPRWASRITLEITEVRIQRVQEISEEDAVAEGSQIPCAELPKGLCRQAAWSERQAFSRIWDSINAKRGFGWEKNPWVWALTFRRLA